MQDNDDGNDGLNDEESIHFVGDITSEKQEVDYDSPLWMIEIEYSSTVTFHTVNGANAREALRAALMEAKAAGEFPVTAEGIRIAHMEDLGK